MFLIKFYDYFFLRAILRNLFSKVNLQRNKANIERWPQKENQSFNCMCVFFFFCTNIYKNGIQSVILIRFFQQQEKRHIFGFFLHSPHKKNRHNCNWICLQNKTKILSRLCILYIIVRQSRPGHWVIIICCEYLCLVVPFQFLYSLHKILRDDAVFFFRFLFLSFVVAVDVFHETFFISIKLFLALTHYAQTIAWHHSSITEKEKEKKKRERHYCM